jgi:hypothetical protein
MGHINPGLIWKAGDTVYASTFNKFLTDATIKKNVITSDMLVKDLQTLIENIQKGVYSTLYKVGSILHCTYTDNPSLQYGGTWVRRKARFLIASDEDENTPAADAKYPLNSEGGTAENEFDWKSLPPHSHGMMCSLHNVFASNDASIFHDNDRNMEKKFDSQIRYKGNWRYFPGHAGENYVVDKDPAYPYIDIFTQGQTADPFSNVTDEDDDGKKSLNNLPPYRAVFVWEKVSDLAPDAFKAANPEAYKKYFGDN